MAAAAAVQFRHRESASRGLHSSSPDMGSVADRLEGVLQSHKFFQSPTQTSLLQLPSGLGLAAGQQAPQPLSSQQAQLPGGSHRTASNSSSSVSERMGKAMRVVLAAVRLKNQHRSKAPSEDGTGSDELQYASGQAQSTKEFIRDSKESEGPETEENENFGSQRSRTGVGESRRMRSGKSLTGQNSGQRSYSTKAVFQEIDDILEVEYNESERKQTKTSFMPSTPISSRWPRYFRTSTFDTEASHRSFKGTPRQVRVHRVVTSPFFEAAMGVTILANLVFITTEQAYRLEGRHVNAFDAAEHAFLTIYVLELLARFYIWGLACLRNNYVLLDFIIVVMGVIATWILKPAFAGDVDGLGPMFMLRIARLIRLVRALRLLMIFRELWMLVAGLLNALRTMLYTLFLLLIILYAFGIIGLELLANHSLVHGESADPDFKAIVDANFSDLPTTMLSLLQFVTFDNVVHIYKPLVTRDWSLLIFFGLVILVLGIVLMNLVTAVIVNSALEQATQDKDLTKSIEQARKKKLVKEMRKIFLRLDEDSSGDISREEIQNINDADKEILRKLMGMNNPLEIFDALDVDGDEEIGIDEFVDGIWQVIISDTPIHVKRMEKQMAFLRQEVQDTQDLQLEFQQKMEEKMDQMIGLGRIVPSQSGRLMSPAMVGAPSLTSVESDNKWQMREQSLQNWQAKELSLPPAVREQSISPWVSASQHSVGHQGDGNQDARNGTQIVPFPPRVVVQESGHLRVETAKQSTSSSASGQDSNGICPDGSKGMSAAPLWAMDLIQEVRALRSVTSKLTFRETMKERRKLVARGIRPPKATRDHQFVSGHDRGASPDHSRDGSSDDDSFNSKSLTLLHPPASPRTPLTPPRTPLTPPMRSGGTASSSGKSRHTGHYHHDGVNSRGAHNIASANSDHRHGLDVRDSRGAGKDSPEEGSDSGVDTSGSSKFRNLEQKAAPLPPLLEQPPSSCSTLELIDAELHSPQLPNLSSHTQTLAAALSRDSHLTGPGSESSRRPVPDAASTHAGRSAPGWKASSTRYGSWGASPPRVESL